MSSGNSCCCFSNFKVFLGALAVALLLWLLVVGTPESGELRAKTTSSSRLADRSTVPVESHVEQPKVANHPQSDLNFMSKVRVPKGPDPIHNRRRGIDGRPPSRV